MKNSFRDPNTNILKSWGFAEENQPGDLKREEAVDFDLEPGDWRFDGNKWVPVSETAGE
jgi:hypothetical protein